MSTEPMVTRFGMPLRRDVWRNFQWDFLGGVLISVFTAVLNQFYIPIAIRHGVSDVAVGLLSAAPAMGLLLSPLWAGLATGSSLKAYVVFPGILARASLVLVAIWPKGWVFIAISLWVNFISGIPSPAYAALMTRIYPGELRGRLMGYVRVAMSFAMVIVVYVVGLWSTIKGPAGPLIAAAVTGICSSLAFGRVREVEKPAVDTGKARTGLKEQWQLVRSNRVILMFLLATTLAGFGNLLANPLYQIYQVHTLNLNNLQIAYTRVGYYVLLLVSYYAMGWVIDRWSPKRAMYFGVTAYALTPLFYVLFGNYASVLLACGCLGIGDAAWDIGSMSYVFRAAPGREAVVFGAHLMMVGIRGTIAPLVSTGLLNQVPIWMMFVSASLFGWAGMVVFVFGLGRRRSGSTVSSDGFGAEV